MNKLYNNISNYYTTKINQYGATPKGVDWNSIESQNIRFEQLSKIIQCDDFILADIGCGYGQYCEYLKLNYKNYKYIGYDLSKEMINNANKLYNKNQHLFLHIDNLDTIQNTDYSIASGIFNVKMNHDDTEWLHYILDTLGKINKKSKQGFSFNLLTKYSDKECMKDNLYYADPLFFFDYCKHYFAKNISLNHDYDLYEFTILVRKD